MKKTRLYLQLKIHYDVIGENVHAKMQCHGNNNNNNNNLFLLNGLHVMHMLL